MPGYFTDEALDHTTVWCSPNGTVVIRPVDPEARWSITIPPDESNVDYMEYLDWIEDGHFARTLDADPTEDGERL